MNLVVASLQDVAQIAAPLLAAVAASASWAAVIQTTRVTRTSNQPFLRVQVIVSPKTGCYGGVIINAGDGVASGVGYAIADRQTVIAGYIGHGFLRPGESVEILSTCRPVDKGDRHLVVGMATCRDRFGVPHDWTSDEGHDTNAARTLRSRLRKRPVYGEVVPRLAKWFPYWTDPEVLRRVPITSQRKL